jgi:hypothetical protein
VHDWSDPSAWVGWDVRVNDPAVFDVSIRYSALASSVGGRFVVKAGDQVLRGEVEAAMDSQPRTVNLGQISLGRGTTEISVRAVEIKGTELMRLVSVILSPVEGRH